MEKKIIMINSAAADALLALEQAQNAEMKVKKDLKDYRGPFDPKLTYIDFSKEQLVRLMGSWWKIALGIDLHYRQIIEDRFGEAVARECDTLMWCNLAADEVPLMKEGLGITDCELNVANFWKVMQNDVGFPQGLFNVTWDLKNDNHGILTVHTCLGHVHRLEAKGAEYCNWMCHELETAAFKAYTDAFNPKIKVDCLKIPPRATPNEDYCAWEFTLEK